MPEFSPEAWFGLSGTLIGFVGAALAVVFYFKQRRIKKPAYSSRSTTVFQNLTERYPELEVRYAGEDVTRLTLSQLIFWNGGSETIEAADIAGADPIKVSAKDGVTILTVDVSHADNEANRIQPQIVEDGALVKFDFIDRREGAVFDIIHTGAVGDVYLTGQVIGAGRVRHRKTPAPDAATVIFWALSPILLTIPFLAQNLSPPWSGISAITLVVVFFALVIFGAKLFVARQPESFRVFRRKMSA